MNKTKLPWRFLFLVVLGIVSSLLVSNYVDLDEHRWVAIAIGIAAVLCIAAITEYISSRIQKKPTTWTHVATSALACAAATIAPVILERVPDYWIKEPEILLIAETGPGTLAHWQSYEQGVQAGMKTLLNGGLPAQNPGVDEDNKRKIGYIPLDGTGKRVAINVIEFPSAAKAEDQRTRRREFMEKIAKTRSVIAIAGFVSSTSADEALENMCTLYGANNPAPLLILPMATRTDLLSKYDQLKGHVLRLVPGNKMQAEAIAKLVVKPDSLSVARPLLNQPGSEAKALRVAIFRDGNNGAYSEDLAGKLREILEGDQVRAAPDGSQRGAIVVFDGTVSSAGVGMYVTNSFALLEVDCVVFLGMLDVAIPLTRQLYAVLQASRSEQPKKLPTVIFSDGSVDSAISAYRGGEELLGLNVFGVFPSPEAKATASAEQRMSLETQSPSFFPYGHDTIMLLADFVREGSERPTKRKVLKEGLAFATNEKSYSNTRHAMLGSYKCSSDGELGQSFSTYQLKPKRNGAAWGTELRAQWQPLSFPQGD